MIGKEDAQTCSPVAAFYEGKTVFITGATGFMGKVLVEKLLSSTDVKKIYLLIRAKKGNQTDQRLTSLLNERVFRRVRTERPGILSKIEAVAGDLEEPRLGISVDDQQTLASEVNIVFHCAATVRFNEDIRKAVAMNVEGVLWLITLAKQMASLEALVHVSTAYCNCHESKINETIIPLRGDPRDLIELCKSEWLDSDTLNSPFMTQKLIGKRPNSYTLTKAAAENLLVAEGAGLPIAIVRPSIVGAAWKEPLPGWVDNLNGPTGLFAGASRGVIRSVHCKRDMLADVVPVDIPINLMCCVAWRTAMQPTGSIQVYNCTSGSTNPFRWGEIETLGFQAWEKYPPSKILWYPGGTMKDSAIGNAIAMTLAQMIPAYLVDGLLKLAREKPFLVNVYKRTKKSIEMLVYFTTHEWTWTNTNSIALWREITDGDRDRFNFDICSLDWRDYTEVYIQGINEFVFHDDPTQYPAYRRNMRKMYWVDRICRVAFLLFVLGLVLYSSRTARYLFCLLLSCFWGEDIFSS